jgi:hypothetical protein
VGSVGAEPTEAPRYFAERLPKKSIASPTVAEIWPPFIGMEKARAEFLSNSNKCTPPR